MLANLGSVFFSFFSFSSPCLSRVAPHDAQLDKIMRIDAHTYALIYLNKPMVTVYSSHDALGLLQGLLEPLNAMPDDDTQVIEPKAA